jgi:quercetin 2,3-dioxygenase
MDQMGEVDYAPGEPKVTPWHPHRGFETVTYMIDGVFRHQDSNGGGGLITDGDTQWMTAGAGLSLALITLLTSTASSAFSHYLAQYPRNPTRESSAPGVRSFEAGASPAVTLLCPCPGVCAPL